MKLYLVVLSILLATSYAWVLQTNVDEINPQKSQSLELECKQNHAPNERTNIKKINRIRITKLYTFDYKTSLAEISLRKNIVKFSTDDSVKVTGNVHQDKVAFLKVTLPNVGRDDVGAYGCEVDGFDERDNFVTLDVAPKIVKEIIVTMDDVNKLIKAVKDEQEIKEKIFAKENAVLRSLLQDGLTHMRQEMKDKEVMFTTQMVNLRNDLDLIYATKNELATGISESKNYTVHEIKEDNRIDEMKHNQILDALQNSSNAWETKFSKMALDLSELSLQLNTSITLVEGNQFSFYNYVTSSFEDINSEIKAVDNKYENVTGDIEVEFDKKVSESKCSCQPTETEGTPMPILETTSKPSENKTIEWPRGNYGLVETTSGCPNPQKLTTKVDEPKNKFVKLVIRHGRKDVSFKHCVMDVKASSSWPKGDYCIIQNNGSCPDGFIPGSKMVNVFSRNKEIGHYRDDYCCRSDAPASKPMSLPTDKPFYLYRYHGACQQVDGMDVTEHSTKRLMGKSVHVKVSTMGQIKSLLDHTVLCYYEHPSNKPAVDKPKVKPKVKSGGSSESRDSDEDDD